MRVQIQEVILLEANKVKGRPGPAPNDADALAKLQGVLEPRDVLRVQLDKGIWGARLVSFLDCLLVHQSYATQVMEAVVAVAHDSQQPRLEPTSFNPRTRGISKMSRHGPSSYRSRYLGNRWASARLSSHGEELVCTSALVSTNYILKNEPSIYPQRAPPVPRTCRGRTAARPLPAHPGL